MSYVGKKAKLNPFSTHKRLALQASRGNFVGELVITYHSNEGSKDYLRFTLANQRIYHRSEILIEGEDYT